MEPCAEPLREASGAATPAEFVGLVAVKAFARLCNENFLVQNVPEGLLAFSVWVANL